jgi:hypothetical protein
MCTLLIEKPSGVTAANAITTKIVRQKRDRPLAKEGSPTLNRRGMVKLKMAERNEVSRFHCDRRRLNVRGGAKQIYFSYSVGLMAERRRTV